MASNCPAKVTVGLPRQGRPYSLSAHGKTLHVKYVSAGNYSLRISGQRRVRWASHVQDIREDVAHFVSTGALPRSKGGWA